MIRKELQTQLKLIEEIDALTTFDAETVEDAARPHCRTEGQGYRTAKA